MIIGVLVDGKVKEVTIRSLDCKGVLSPHSKVRCESCQNIYRSYLRHNNAQAIQDRTSSSSRVKFSNLSYEECQQRLKHLRNDLTFFKAKNSALITLFEKERANVISAPSNFNPRSSEQSTLVDAAALP